MDVVVLGGHGQVARQLLARLAARGDRARGIVRNPDQADDLRHTVNTVLGITAEDTGQPFDRIYEDSLHDRWFTATQAKEYGFIDHIVDSFGQVVPQRQRIGITA